MNKAWLTKGLALLGFVGALTFNVHASYDESSNVQNTNGDASPAISGINDYRYQDEQLNLDPRAGLVKVLRTDQKALVNDFVTELIPVNNAFPRELRSAIRSATGMEGGRCEVVRDKVNGKAYLQVMAPKYMMPYLRSAIKSLDEDWVEEYNDGAMDEYLKLSFRPDPAGVDSIAARYAGSEGFTTIDTTNNAIRVFDEVMRVEKYSNAVKAIDIPINQVELEVTIYSVDVNDDLKLGLDYVAWSNGPGRNLWSFATAGFSSEHRAKNMTSIFDPFIGLANNDPSSPIGDKALIYDAAARGSYRAVNYVLPSAYVDFLHAKGQATVVSSQTVTVKTGETASISTMDELVAFVNNTNGPDDFASPAVIDLTTLRIPTDGVEVDGDDIDIDYFATPYPDSSRRVYYENAGSVGIDMEVTPFVGLKSMELFLDLEVNEQSGISGNGLPTINSRNVETTVRLLDGQEFVIAGLTQTNDAKSTAKAPWFGDLPIIGYLAGGETDLNRKSELVVTITPTFILSSDHAVGLPARVKTLENIVAGDGALGVPAASAGYDMWLLTDDCLGL